MRALLAQLDGTVWLIANLLYGSGLRLMEALRLRIKDLVMARGEIIVREAKGGKDRVTVSPAPVVPPLRAHLAKLRDRFERQRRLGEPGVTMPAALVQKYPHSACEWGWQYVFPATSLCQDAYSGRPVRHHQHEKTVQRAVQLAVRKAGICQPASCHTFRHSSGSRIIPATDGRCAYLPEDRAIGGCIDGGIIRGL